MTNNINPNQINVPDQSSENSSIELGSPTDQKINELTFQFFSNHRPIETGVEEEMKEINEETKNIIPTTLNGRVAYFRAIGDLTAIWSANSIALNSLNVEESLNRNEMIQQSEKDCLKLDDEYKQLQNRLEASKNRSKAETVQLTFCMKIGNTDYSQQISKDPAGQGQIQESKNDPIASEKTQPPANPVSIPFDYDTEFED